MATRYYYFLSPTLPPTGTITRQLAVGSAFAVVAPTFTQSPFTVVSVDDAIANAEADLLDVMASYGFTFVVSTLVLPVFGTARHFGKLAAAPVTPAPASGDRYFDTVIGGERYYSGTAWADLSSELLWGDGTLTATTTTRFLTPGFADGTAATTAIQWRVTRSGVLRRLRVRHNTTAGNGLAIVYTLRVNGVVTALTVSLASTAADGADLVNSVAVVAGDLIDIQVTKAASVATSPSNVVAALEFGT